MGTLLRSSGDANVVFQGNYHFSDGTLYLPEVSVLPTPAAGVGSIYHVKTSGVIAVQSGVGGQYATFALGSLPFDFGGGSGQSPLDISSGLLAWYDATESPQSFVGGSGVTSWDDLSGNGMHLDANDGPPDKGNDGGVSGMFLNGTNDLFITTGSGPGSGIEGVDHPFTIIFALRQTDITNVGAIYSFAHSTVNVVNHFGILRDNGSWQMFKRDNVGNAPAVGPLGQSDSTIPQIISYTCEGTEASIFASGTAQTAAPSGFSAAGIINGLTLNAFGGLHRFGFGKSAWYKGWFYSIAMWDRELTSQERVDIEKNFAERYNVSMGTYEENQ